MTNTRTLNGVHYTPYTVQCIILSYYHVKKFQLIYSIYGTTIPVTIFVYDRLENLH